MMYQMRKLPYNYVPEYRLQVLELPYAQDELSMLLLLPDEVTGGSNPLRKVTASSTHKSSGSSSYHHAGHPPL